METETELESQVREVTESVIGHPLERTSGLLDEAILDSLLTMKLIGSLEERFDITFETSDFSYYNFNSIGAIAALVSRYMDRQG